MKELTIASVEALPCSVPLRQAVTQGLGSVTKRDTVVVKVTTTDGRCGYGECYNGRAPLAVAATVNTTLRDLMTGLDAGATTAAWDVFERRVLANHGTCASCVCAMSGVDMALWDVAGKALDAPLYRLLGGSAREIPAYAGGFALGYAAPGAVADEALSQVAAGYAAVKLRLGDNLERDSERAVALRAALGPDVAMLADANARYSVSDVRAMLPVLAEVGAGWLEERGGHGHPARRPRPGRGSRRGLPARPPAHRRPGLAGQAGRLGPGCASAAPGSRPPARRPKVAVGRRRRPHPFPSLLLVIFSFLLVIFRGELRGGT